MSRFLNIKDIKPGMRIKADSGFSCIPPNSIRTVFQDTSNRLYVCCLREKHYIDGQLDNHGNVIGFTDSLSEPASS